MIWRRQSRLQMRARLKQYLRPKYYLMNLIEFIGVIPIVTVIVLLWFSICLGIANWTLDRVLDARQEAIYEQVLVSCYASHNFTLAQCQWLAREFRSRASNP